MRRSARLSQLAGGLLASAVLCMSTPIDAAEIKVLSLPPLQSAMSDLVPQFERLSDHKVTIEYATPGLLLERLKTTDADVVIMTKQGIAALQRQNTIAAGSDTDIAKVGMGVFVRKGAPKPNIGSIENFKRALVTAKSIAYIDPASGAPGGIYLAGLFERLGIAGELKPKQGISDRAVPKQPWRPATLSSACRKLRSSWRSPASNWLARS